MMPAHSCQEGGWLAQRGGLAMRHQVPDRVVTIGGGTGSFTMLSELKKVTRNL